VGASYPPPSCPTEHRAEGGGGEPEAGAAEAASPGQHMVSTHPGADAGMGMGEGGCLPAPCPQRAAEGFAVGLEGFAVGLGTRGAPLTAPEPAKNKEQHLFGRGGQRRAQGLWCGCPAVGHRRAGDQDMAAGEPPVSGACGDGFGGSELEDGLVPPKEPCPQGRGVGRLRYALPGGPAETAPMAWGGAGLGAPRVVQLAQPSWLAFAKGGHAMPCCALPSHAMPCHVTCRAMP